VTALPVVAIAVAGLVPAVIRVVGDLVIRGRRRTMTIEVSGPKGDIKLEATNVDDVALLLDTLRPLLNEQEADQ